MEREEGYCKPLCLRCSCVWLAFVVCRVCVFGDAVHFRFRSTFARWLTHFLVLLPLQTLLLIRRLLASFETPALRERERTRLRERERREFKYFCEIFAQSFCLDCFLVACKLILFVYICVCKSMWECQCVRVQAALCCEDAPKVSQKVAVSTSRASTDLFAYLLTSVVFRLEVASSRQQLISS